MRLVTDLTLCGRMVESLGLFSRNETIDEVSTTSLPFMMVQYMTGMASQKIITESKEDRVYLLMGSKSCLGEFMGLLESYEVYKGDGKKKVDPMEMRTAKIDRMRRIMTLEKSVTERKSIISSAVASVDLEGDEPVGGVDEELVRLFHLDQLVLCALRTEQELSLIDAELELLKHHDESTEKPQTTIRPPSNVRKVVQPFTLFSSKRDQLKAGVFRPGHNLPTMTIDEYLELERQRGGIIEGGGPADVQESEDEDVWQDDEERRQKDIRTDKLRDEHRRGSGNTYNRG